MPAVSPRTTTDARLIRWMPAFRLLLCIPLRRPAARLFCPFSRWVGAKTFLVCPAGCTFPGVFCENIWPSQALCVGVSSFWAI